MRIQDLLTPEYFVRYGILANSLQDLISNSIARKDKTYFNEELDTFWQQFKSVYCTNQRRKERFSQLESLLTNAETRNMREFRKAYGKIRMAQMVSENNYLLLEAYNHWEDDIE